MPLRQLIDDCLADADEKQKLKFEQFKELFELVLQNQGIHDPYQISEILDEVSYSVYTDKFDSKIRAICCKKLCYKYRRNKVKTKYKKISDFKK